MRDVIDVTVDDGRIWPLGARRVTGSEVLERVAAKHSMPVSALKSRSTLRRFSNPRLEAYYELRRLCSHLSWPHIGDIMGGRDHTTCMVGAVRYAERNGLPVL